MAYRADIYADRSVRWIDDMEKIHDIVLTDEQYSYIVKNMNDSRIRNNYGDVFGRRYPITFLTFYDTMKKYELQDSMKVVASKFIIYLDKMFGGPSMGKPTNPSDSLDTYTFPISNYII